MCHTYPVYVYSLVVLPLASSESPGRLSGVHGLFSSASSIDGRPELGLAFSMATVSRSDSSASGTRTRHPASTDNAPVAFLLDFVDQLCARPAPLALAFRNG